MQGKIIYMERADCYITSHIKVQTSEEEDSYNDIQAHSHI
jgi:hypothetical protein